jgi:hypothetical protein
MGSFFFFYLEKAMRYHFQKPHIYRITYGKTYTCDHQVYNECTLYSIGDTGLSVIQQRYDPNTKMVYWSSIDPWLVDSLYLNENFQAFYEKYASEPLNGLYPTVTVRQIIWHLRMKPLKKEPWETAFDHIPI